MVTRFFVRPISMVLWISVLVTILFASTRMRQICKLLFSRLRAGGNTAEGRPDQ
jgi:hypothetical protein